MARCDPKRRFGLLQPPIGYMNVLQWGANASTIYGGEGAESGAPEFIYSITAQGAALTTTYLGALYAAPPQLIYDSRQARLYTSGVMSSMQQGGQTSGFFSSSSKRRCPRLRSTAGLFAGRDALRGVLGRRLREFGGLQIAGF